MLFSSSLTNTCYCNVPNMYYAKKKKEKKKNRDAS